MEPITPTTTLHAEEIRRQGRCARATAADGRVDLLYADDTLMGAVVSEEIPHQGKTSGSNREVFNFAEGLKAVLFAKPDNRLVENTSVRKRVVLFFH